jgi:hypothetical protein
VDEAANYVVTIDAMVRRGSGGDHTGRHFELDTSMRALPF